MIEIQQWIMWLHGFTLVKLTGGGGGGGVGSRDLTEMLPGSEQVVPGGSTRLKT